MIDISDVDLYHLQTITTFSPRFLLEIIVMILKSTGCPFPAFIVFPQIFYAINFKRNHILFHFQPRVSKIVTRGQSQIAYTVHGLEILDAKLGSGRSGKVRLIVYFFLFFYSKSFL